MSADSGYCWEDNIQAMVNREIEAFIATGRQKHGEATVDGGKAQGAKMEPMRERLRWDGFANPIACASDRHSSPSSARSSMPAASPMRRLNTVAAEWAMVCAVHNTSSWQGRKDR